MRHENPPWPQKYNGRVLVEATRAKVTAVSRKYTPPTKPESTKRATGWGCPTVKYTANATTATIAAVAYPWCGSRSPR